MWSDGSTFYSRNPPNYSPKASGAELQKNQLGEYQILTVPTQYPPVSPSNLCTQDIILIQYHFCT